MISDIGEGIKNHISLYADDTRLYGRVKNTNDVQDMQIDLESVYEWAEVNNMEFNADKFEFIRFGKNDELKNYTNYISSSGEQIQEKDNLRDFFLTLFYSVYSFLRFHVGFTDLKWFELIMCQNI